MVSKQKNLREECIRLEEKLRDLEQRISRSKKDKESKQNTSEFLKKEIKEKQKEIFEKLKQISNFEKMGKQQSQDVLNKDIATASHEEVIMKTCISIVKNYNLNLSEKLKTNVEYLMSLEKNLKIHYLIIKKLDIREEWLKEQRIDSNGELFENLKQMSKIRKLNYASMKKCGPILLFRIFEETTFKDIKQRSCEILNVNQSTYKLYDEAFNNLDCCLNSRLNDFFSNYEPLDRTFKPGEVCFYLLEKIKHQNSFLDLHIKSVDAKSSNKEDDKGDENNFRRGDFVEHLKYVENGLVLKGIKSYEAHPFDQREQLENAFKEADNFFIFPIATILFIILSLISISSKKNVSNWGIGMWNNRFNLGKFTYQNQFIFNNATNSSNLKFNFNDLADYLYYYSEFFSEAMNPNISKYYTLMGPIRVRYLRLYFNNICPSTISGINIKDQITNLDNQKLYLCYYDDHSGSNRNTSGVWKYTFKNETNISYTLVTPLGTYDTSGTVMEFSPFNPIVQTNLSDLQYIIQNKLLYLGITMRAIEISITYYLQNYDVFITNLIVIERDKSNNPLITIHESIPFMINVYETTTEKILLGVDTARAVLIIIMFISIFAKAAQKYYKSKTKGILRIFKCYFETFVQVKFIILTIAFAMYMSAFAFYLSSTSRNSQDSYNTTVFYDYYSYALSQKNSRAYEILSLFFVFTYSLKFFLFLDTFHTIYAAFKASVIEYSLLTGVIAIVYIGLSLFTYFIYGQYIFEYSTFTSSLLFNLKIFIFSENTIDIIQSFLNHYRSLSILLYILFICVLRYFLIFLYYPIFIENYRIEMENNVIPPGQNPELLKLTLNEKISLFFKPWQKKFKKINPDEVNDV